MVFPIVMYGCESWTIKKAEYQWIDAFELWCWRRLLRVSWNSRRSNESILKEISPEYSLEGLMLKLKLQYSGHLMWRTDSLEKTLMLGKIESGRFFECWVSSQLFHSPLSPSSRGSLVSLYFLPLEWYHLHIWGCWYFSQQTWFQLVIHPARHFTYREPVFLSGRAMLGVHWSRYRRVVWGRGQASFFLRVHI